jgi:phosphoribosylamine---glycine ligase
LLGGGGREHALAWKLAQSPLCGTLYCAPGNPGIAQEPNVSLVSSIKDSNHAGIVDFCKRSDIGLVFVGPEAPLVEGLVDALQDAQVPTFGPTRAAAQLEGSKTFMKVHPQR